MSEEREKNADDHRNRESWAARDGARNDGDLARAASGKKADRAAARFGKKK